MFAGRGAVIRAVVQDPPATSGARSDGADGAGYGAVDAYLDSLLAYAPSCVAVVRGHALRFTLVNARYQAIRPDLSMPGLTYRDVFPEAADGGAEARLRAVIETGEPWSVERYLAPVPGKADATWEGQVTRLPPVLGDDPAALIVLWDVTDQCRTEAALRESEARLRRVAAEAEAASRAKDRFLAVLSHELRTPLSPVLMTASAMERDPGLPERFRDDLLTIRRNVELEAKLIDDLLDLSRITSGKLHLRHEPVALHELLRHVLEVCATDLLAKRLRITFDLRATVDLVTGDPARLQQVFWNLLKNAIKFSPEQSLIGLRTADAGEGRIRVEVADDGVGIPADVLPRVFDAFEQGDPAVTRQFGGLGLGLAISRSLVDLHGGTIAAASAGPGHGATFTVTLPTAHAGAERSAARDSSTPRSASAKPQSLRILLVEDHPDTARVLARLLANSGAAVETAHTVADALRLGRAGRFDLLISDIGLPDGSGLDVMHALRPLGIRGIALSGYGMEDDASKSRDAGFAEHLIKPLTLEDLAAAIARVTRR